MRFILELVLLADGHCGRKQMLQTEGLISSRFLINCQVTFRGLRSLSAASDSGFGLIWSPKGEQDSCFYQPNSCLSPRLCRKAEGGSEPLLALAD